MRPAGGRGGAAARLVCPGEDWRSRVASGSLVLTDAMRSSKSEGNLLGFGAHRLLPTARQRPELVGRPTGAGVGADGTAQVQSPPWGIAQPPAPGARVQHGQEPGESLSSPLRPLFRLPHGLAVGAGCPGGGSVTPCDQRSLGTLCAALDIRPSRRREAGGPGLLLTVPAGLGLWTHLGLDPQPASSS